MNRKLSPEINAGSMADIAFLLLVFFLVTTTLSTDAGIFRRIPEKPIENHNITIKEKNILEVHLNFKNALFVENNQIDFKELKQIAINFIDNAAGLDKYNQPCDWCNGLKDLSSSDHPTKAVISLHSDRRTNYETYIKTLDILNSAYSHLRNKLAVKLYQQNYSSLVEEYESSNYKNTDLAEKIKFIRSCYPVLLSDAEIKN